MKLDGYNTEVQTRWGKTHAYKQYAEKTKQYSKETWDALTTEMNRILAEFANRMNQGKTSDSPEVQTLVKQLQEHLTEHYYQCTDEILAGLGQMYVLDKRFQSNIDRHATGTAEFISKAIKIYCKK